MRNILILCGVVLAALIGWVAWRLTAPAHYGQPFQGAPRAELAELLSKPEQFKDRTVSVSGTVYRQCPVTGCWFYFRTDDGRELRVELGDVAPGLPKRTGSSATVEGRLIPQGSNYLFVGTGVEFGKPNAAVKPVPIEDKVKQAAQESKPMVDGYPINFCIVGGEDLGSMGEPFNYVHEGRTVKFCCKGCVNSFKKDPAHFLGVLDKAAAEKTGKP